MNDSCERVREMLFSLRDEKYGEFSSKLIPNIEREKIIGVRAPDIRALAKRLMKEEKDTAENFTKELAHAYVEENMLHGFIIGGYRDYNKVISETDRFLPYIDNWAVCDMFSPKVFGKHTLELLPKIREWTNSSHIYSVRFGIETLMRYYLDGENFSAEYPNLVFDIARRKSGEYYLDMMIAWYFATAIAKQYDAVFPYIAERRLPKWIHNKTIQKAIESYRVSDEHKKELRELKIK